MNIQREITLTVRETIHLNSNECWNAVQTKDKRFDGMFFFGVKTTGIYCRPSCSARTPLRQNVAFFDSVQSALQAGFRACKRCKPDVLNAHDPQTELVQRICEVLSRDSENPPDLEMLGEQFKLSPQHLQRVFKSVVGISPKQYVSALRSRQFKALVNGGKTVTEAMYEAGYSSSSRLYEKASAQFGMTPSDYKRGGIGRDISYTIVSCSLGYLLVAATEHGICSVVFGDAPDALEANLHKEFPAAQIQNDSEASSNLALWTSAIIRHLEGTEPYSISDLPLDLRATAFQQRVWEELRRIPYGETRSYSEIAESIGKPNAVRAVANACASNPVAVVTPCHRVVRENGAISGYRWGVARKKQLLTQEKQGRQAL